MIGPILSSQQTTKLKAAGTIGLILFLPALLVFPDLSAMIQ